MTPAPELRGSRAGSIFVLGVVWAAHGSSARAAPPVDQPHDPEPVIDGTVVPECAWPSVVVLYGTRLEGTARCTGFYIGGRVILTAAHCMLPEFHVKPTDGKPTCDTDADCPNEDVFGEPITAMCPGLGSDFCRDPDLTKSNDIVTARFGETYPDEGTDGHIRHSVEIAYCRRRPEYVDDDTGGDPNDFAYCILRQAPNVQPIPIAMHCEVEQFLAEGTPVTAVGFGKSSYDMVADEPGIKRMATSVLSSAVGPSHQTFTITEDWSPGWPAKGDSGGPLLVELPDGTWRAIGVASSGFPEYVPPWRHVAWMLADPNVVQADIIPCHTPQGEWAPGPGCGGFPLSPGTPAGSWGRGPMSCFDPEVGGQSQTCGPPGDGGSGGADETGAPTMGVIGGDDGGQSQKDVPPSRGSACACRARPVDSGSWLPLGGLAALVMLGPWRRSRRARWRSAAAHGLALAAIVALLGGCSDNQVGTSASAGTADDGGGGGPPPGPPPIDPNNPAYQGILGGIDPDPAIDYHDLAVGNVSRAASSSECCQDYVIASPSTSVVRVLFSEDLPGLTFLADTPDELVDVGGPGVEDVLLADLDGDDRNDLVALRSDGVVAVVRGVAGPPGGPFFDAASLDTFSAGAGAGAMTAVDLDCDGDLDLAVTAPAEDAFVLLAGGGNGTFAIPLPRDAGSSPQDITTGDVDGDADLDVAVSNDNGSFSISINECTGSFAAPVSYEIYPTSTPHMPIAMGKLCPGHPNDVAVAVGIFDIVYLTCGDGTGNFTDIVEPHGIHVVAPYDYAWDRSTGEVTENRITDLNVWPSVPTLYTLRTQTSNTSEIAWLPPNPAQMFTYGDKRLVVQLEGGAPFSEFVIHATNNSGDSWNRIGFVGSAGLGATK